MITLESLLSKWTEAIIVNGQESWQGNYKVANRAYGRARDYLEQIRESGTPVTQVMKGLLSHENAYVRVAAAHRVLAMEPEAAIPVLRAVAKEGGGPGFSADTILTEYAKGRLFLS